MPSQDPLLTDMRHAPGWYAMLPRPAPANRLKGQQVADWVVVGAGVTGLAAARELTETSGLTVCAYVASLSIGTRPVV